METDKDGNPVDHDSFAYEIDGEGDIILNESESYENSMDITNSKNTTPEPTVTNTPVPSGQPTVTPSREQVHQYLEVLHKYFYCNGG